MEKKHQGQAVETLTPGVFKSFYLKRNPLRRENLVDLLHDFKGIRHVKNIGFAPSPSTIGVGIDRTAFRYETPSDDMRLLSVAAGRQSLGMARRTAGLAHLVQVSHETQNSISFSGLIHRDFVIHRRLELAEEI